MVNFVRERILELMHKENLTGYTLAELCDIPRSTINNYTTGKTVPSIAAIEQLCKGLNMNVMEFFEPFMAKFSRGTDEHYLTILRIFETIPPEDRELFCQIFILMLALYHRSVPMPTI